MIIWWVTGSIAFALSLVALHDMLQRRHAVLRIYPLVGHLRYIIEAIGPELRQYIVADDKEETPFNRSERSWVYATAKGQNNLTGFGTTELYYTTGYPIIKNSGIPFPESRAHFLHDDPSCLPCLKVVGASHGRKRCWRPRSIVNISGMSFGALGRNAIRALNKGAKLAGCYHSTGEGGFSEYHREGADVIWQLGTGYFGARDEEGRFSLDVVAETVEQHPEIRAIEIKLSQGAKPGKGGVLPAAKVVPEIARARRVPEGEDCISPNAHTEFTTPEELVAFVERIADRTGLPVGIKAAIGDIAFYEELALIMAREKRGPDFIQVDGGEGGTGAAPLTYTDHVALPFKVAFARIYEVFQRVEVSRDVVWIGSGKLGFPDRAAIALAMGCDMIAVAREAMMSVGCIQSRSCHTGRCPTGVTTMDPWRQRGLDPEGKAVRAATYIKGFRKELLSLAHTAGYQHPGQFTGKDIELSVGVNQFETLDRILGYSRDPVEFTSMADLLPVGDQDC
ncbi:MAG: FMN-binding glutamate synthase family protein [Gammaproteobacteria bacterium]|nr:FMN-binding glutamate synthase family protein [Gammaproteobacteria bacterium]